MNYNISETNFYKGLQELDTINVVSLILNVVVFLVGPLLLYSVIWYERFSADLIYRTLINQLLSHLCRMQIAICLSTRFSYFVVFYLSPLPTTICNLNIFSGRVAFSLMIIQITARQFIKYLYIFKWKTIVSLNDDFFAIYISATNIIFCFVFAFVTYFLGFHLEEPGMLKLVISICKLCVIFKCQHINCLHFCKLKTVLRHYIASNRAK